MVIAIAPVDSRQASQSRISRLYGTLVVFVLVTSVPPEVSIPVTIPVVVVLNPPAIALPIASVVLAALVSWAYPTCTAIWRTSPVSAMPLVTVSYWILRLRFEGVRIYQKPFLVNVTNDPVDFFDADHSVPGNGRVLILCFPV